MFGVYICVVCVRQKERKRNRQRENLYCTYSESKQPDGVNTFDEVGVVQTVKLHSDSLTRNICIIRFIKVDYGNILLCARKKEK